MQFSLGEQPEWAGISACVPKGKEFIEVLLTNPTPCLIERGYAVVKVSQELYSCYSAFHAVWEEFSALPQEEKSRYAVQQFNQRTNSPNQYHGFSVVRGLKEQFMLRSSCTNFATKLAGPISPTSWSF
mmetsp:Transcript_14072/g.17743  ORF Transcript_14072/g.17743 Transcript_14072/m.17743 type:complete len:128 (+) Transcript_14072:161-544(+)